MAPCFDCQQGLGGPDSRLLAGPFMGAHGAAVYRCLQCGTEWNREAPGTAVQRWGTRRRPPLADRRDADDSDPAGTDSLFG